MQQANWARIQNLFWLNCNGETKGKKCNSNNQILIDSANTLKCEWLIGPTLTSSVSLFVCFVYVGVCVCAIFSNPWCLSRLSRSPSIIGSPSFSFLISVISILFNYFSRSPPFVTTHGCCSPSRNYLLMVWPVGILFFHRSIVPYLSLSLSLSPPLSLSLPLSLSYLGSLITVFLYH